MGCLGIVQLMIGFIFGGMGITFYYARFYLCHARYYFGKKKKWAKNQERRCTSGMQVLFWAVWVLYYECPVFILAPLGIIFAFLGIIFGRLGNISKYQVNI